MRVRDVGNTGRCDRARRRHRRRHRRVLILRGDGGGRQIPHRRQEVGARSAERQVRGNGTLHFKRGEGMRKTEYLLTDV